MLWVIRRQYAGVHDPGDAIDARDGVGHFQGLAPQQSEDWRVIVVSDGSVEALRQMALFKRLLHPATNQLMLHRVRHLDIAQLENYAVARTGRPLSSDDVLEVDMKMLTMFVRDKALPIPDGVLA